MDALELIYRLRRAGKTQRQIAAELSVSHSAVNNVIHNRATCFPIAKHIAGLLSEDVDTLFPGRYRFKPRERRPSLSNSSTDEQRETEAESAAKKR